MKHYSQNETMILKPLCEYYLKGLNFGDVNSPSVTNKVFDFDMSSKPYSLIHFPSEFRLIWKDGFQSVMASEDISMNDLIDILCDCQNELNEMSDDRTGLVWSCDKWWSRKKDNKGLEYYQVVTKLGNIKFSNDGTGLEIVITDNSDEDKVIHIDNKTVEELFNWNRSESRMTSENQLYSMYCTDGKVLIQDADKNIEITLDEKSFMKILRTVKSNPNKYPIYYVHGKDVNRCFVGIKEVFVFLVENIIRNEADRTQIDNLLNLLDDHRDYSREQSIIDFLNKYELKMSLYD